MQMAGTGAVSCRASRNFSIERLDDIGTAITVIDSQHRNFMLWDVNQFMAATRRERKASMYVSYAVGSRNGILKIINAYKHVKPALEDIEKFPEEGLQGMEERLVYVLEQRRQCLDLYHRMKEAIDAWWQTCTLEQRKDYKTRLLVAYGRDEHEFDGMFNAYFDDWRYFPST